MFTHKAEIIKKNENEICVENKKILSTVHQQNPIVFLSYFPHSGSDRIKDNALTRPRVGPSPSVTRGGTSDVFPAVPVIREVVDSRWA